MERDQPSVAAAATRNSYELKYLSVILVWPSCIFLLYSLLSYGVGGSVQALKGPEVRQALACWGALNCCVFCIVTTLLGASGSIVQPRRNLMSTLVCASFSCSFALMSNFNAILHHNRRSGNWKGAPSDLVMGNSVLLLFWLVFARQAADYVAERTGLTSSAPHMQMRLIASVLRQWAPVVFASCLSGIAVTIPRARVPVSIGLLSVGLNSIGNAIVVYHFYTTWVPVIRAAAPPGTGTAARLFIEAHPLIIGVLVESLIIPMLLTTFFRLDFFVELEQLWLTCLLPVRVLALVICFQTVNTAGDEMRQLQLELGVAREGLRVKDQVNTYRAQFLRYVFHEIRNPLNSIHLGIQELQDLLKGESGDKPTSGGPDWLALPRAAILDLAKTMSASSDTMRVIIDDVLDVSKIQGSAFRLRFEPMQLLEEVHLAVKHLKAHAQSMQVALEVREPEGEADGLGTGFFIADRTRFMQVLVNLVSNACKFSPQDGSGRVIVSVRGGRWSTLEEQKSGSQASVKQVAADEDSWTGTVQIECPRTGERKHRPCAASCDPTCSLKFSKAAWDAHQAHCVTHPNPGLDPTVGQNTSEVEAATAASQWPLTGRIAIIEIVVCDQGCGISADDMSKLFRPFAQLEQGLSYGASGTGLGLAISREIVVRHGGCIGVVSETGSGCDFLVRLPLLECDMTVASMRGAGLGAKRSSRVDLASGKLVVRPTSPSEDSTEHIQSTRSSDTSNSSSRALLTEVHPDTVSGQDTGTTGSGDGSEQVESTAATAASSTPGRDAEVSEDVHSNTAEGGSEASRRGTEPEHFVLGSDGRGSGSAVDSEASEGSSDAGVSAAPPFSDSPQVQQKTLSLRVLIVEDMATVRKLMGRQLRTKLVRAYREVGLQMQSLVVDEAEDGSVAVEAVRAALAAGTPYDVICLEKEMPVMDGYEAARRIRELELSMAAQGSSAVHRALMIGVTGNALMQDQADFSAQGLDQVLTKPVDMGELVEIIMVEQCQHTVSAVQSGWLA